MRVSHSHISSMVLTSSAFAKFYRQSLCIRVCTQAKGHSVTAVPTNIAINQHFPSPRDHLSLSLRSNSCHWVICLVITYRILEFLALVTKSVFSLFSYVEIAVFRLCSRQLILWVTSSTRLITACKLSRIWVNLGCQCESIILCFLVQNSESLSEKIILSASRLWFYYNFTERKLDFVSNWLLRFSNLFFRVVGVDFGLEEYLCLWHLTSIARNTVC